MKKKTFVLIVISTIAFLFTFAFAKHHTAEERGMAHFKYPAFAEGKKPCNACHPDGRGLKDSGTKKSFSIMGGNQSSLEEAINVCIVNANKGNSIDVNSTEMQELVSYIKSLGTKTVPGYGK